MLRGQNEGLSARRKYQRRENVQTFEVTASDQFKKKSPGHKMNWSTIGRVGNSAPAKLTVLSPFIGTYIVFNENISKYFRIPATSVAPSDGHKIITWMQQSSLEFLYFGLIAMGLATFLFQLLAPRQMKMKLGALEYSTNCASANSTAALEVELVELVKTVCRDDINNVSLSNDQAGSLIISIFRSIDFTENHNRGVISNLGRDLVVNGSISPKLIALEVLKPNAKLRALLLTAAADCAVDVFFCNYGAQDVRHPFIRGSVALVMMLGSALMLLPTLSTILTIIGINL